MRFRGLDLNLLVALDALLTEQNVSVAAERVFLSQSAMSGALARLRDYFRDDLLVSAGRRMILTPRAEQLIAPVQAVLMQIDTTIATPSEFSPFDTEREFKIVTSDFATLIMVAPAIRLMSAIAPKARFALEMVDETATDKLERGLVDVVISPRQYVFLGNPMRVLFEEEHAVIGWAGNTHIKDTLSRELFFSLGHVAVRFSHARAPVFEEWLVQASGERRRIEVFTPSFATLPSLVVGGQRIATVHRRLAELFAATAPLNIYPMPIDVPRLDMCAQWHALKDDDAGLRWVVSQLEAAVRPSPELS